MLARYSEDRLLSASAVSESRGRLPEPAELLVQLAAGGSAAFEEAVNLERDV